MAWPNKNSLALQDFYFKTSSMNRIEQVKKFHLRYYYLSIDFLALASLRAEALEKKSWLRWPEPRPDPIYLRDGYILTCHQAFCFFRGGKIK